MGKRVTIPVRVVRPEPVIPRPTETEPGKKFYRDGRAYLHEPAAPVRRESRPVVSEPLHREPAPEIVAAPPAEASAAAAERVPVPASGVQADSDEWRTRALRLQAEMDDYRKRQRRLAQDQVESERQRLLHAFLHVVDDLDRALDAPTGGDQDLRQGVEMIRHGALQMLQQEGVEQIKVERQPFDPNWHEAVSTVPGHERDVEPNTVFQVVDRGYQLGDRLLRPARVVVAV